MCARYLRIILLVTGSLLLFVAAFPLMAFINFGEPLQTTLIASKLVMMPVGAVCFLIAARLRVQHR